MRPVLFFLGNFPIYSYGFMLGLAFLIGVAWALYHSSRYGVSKEAVMEVASLCVIGAVVGSRLAYVILHWDYYGKNLWKVFAVREGGLTFYGGIAGALLLAIPYIVKRKYSLVAFFDLFAPPIALGYAIARIGCFLNGCCYGRVCEYSFFPLGVKFPHLSGFRYPTQIYSLGYSLVIFFILLWLSRKPHFPGALFLDYLWLYGVARFFMEYFREEPFVIGRFLTVGQLACVIIVAVVLFLRGSLQERYAARV
ncbi:MAG: prolipoprotein diacylglyceryl transferase [Candidatus Atribacteria bacterium]|nr:prolipoprotein diacylglyceryl transferase [Candidatus Atribacteria bacterium]